LDRARAS